MDRLLGEDGGEEFRDWLRLHPELTDLGTAEFLSRLQVGRGSKLWLYWTGRKGSARYMGSADPWTTLRDALIKEEVPPGQAPGLATNIMMATPAGRALFKAHHKGKGKTA